MTGEPTIWTYGLLLFCVLIDIGRELNFKAATLRADRDGYVVSLVTHPFLWLGIAFWAVEGATWLLVLEHTPLAIALPIMTLTYAGTPVAAGLVLGEQLNRGQKLGAGLVAVGVLTVSLSDLKG
jgi:drug/metabolite transporter (DMT)-like permease